MSALLVQRPLERVVTLGGPARLAPPAAARSERTARPHHAGGQGILHEELEVILGVDSRTGHLRIAGGHSWVGSVPIDLARELDAGLSAAVAPPRGPRRGPTLPGLGTLVDLVA